MTAPLPSVTLVCPIKGLDVGAAENVLSDLGTAYPGAVETLFVFDTEADPAVPGVRAALAAAGPPRPGRTSAVLFAGEPRPGRTGKLNAMIAGYARAQGELVAFLDSDLRPGPDDLQVLVETLLGDPQAGAAFAPVVAADPPVTLGDVGYALMLNGLYGPVAARLARAHGGDLPFIMGQFMVFRRAALEAIGGLACAEGQLVDDMYLGGRLHALGYRNLMGPRAVAVVQHGLSLREFWGIYIRWITFSRSGLPGRAFKLRTWVRPGLYWVGLLACVAALAAGWPRAALAAGVLPLGVTASIVHQHRLLGGGRLRPLHRLGALALLLVAPAVLASIYLRHEVSWRGRRYVLNAASRLAGSPRAAQGPQGDRPAPSTER